MQTRNIEDLEGYFTAADIVWTNIQVVSVLHTLATRMHQDNVRSNFRRSVGKAVSGAAELLRRARLICPITITAWSDEHRTKPLIPRQTGILTAIPKTRLIPSSQDPTVILADVTIPVGPSGMTYDARHPHFPPTLALIRLACWPIMLMDASGARSFPQSWENAEKLRGNKTGGQSVL